MSVKKFKIPNVRRKGHNYERKIRKELRKLFYPDCETSRFGSKKRDQEGVDLLKSGFLNVQAKSWEAGPPYHKILKEMPDDGNYNVIFHHRKHKGEVVVMSKEDFYEILGTMKSNGIKI